MCSSLLMWRWNLKFYNTLINKGFNAFQLSGCHNRPLRWNSLKKLCHHEYLVLFEYLMSHCKEWLVPSLIKGEFFGGSFTGLDFNRQGSVSHLCQILPPINIFGNSMIRYWINILAVGVFWMGPFRGEYPSKRKIYARDNELNKQCPNKIAKYFHQWELLHICSTEHHQKFTL